MQRDILNYIRDEQALDACRSKLCNDETRHEDKIESPNER